MLYLLPTNKHLEIVTHELHQYKFNGVTLTNETILKTRKYFEEINMGCIAEVKSGEVKVNDSEKYFEQCEAQAESYKDGSFTVTLTFLQRAYYIQTGESVALMPHNQKKIIQLSLTHQIN